MNQLIPGQVIHVVLDSGPGAGQIRPAMVVRVEDEQQLIVEANVLTLGKRDGLNDENPVKVIYSRYADDWRLGSWHWPGEEKRVKGEEGKGEKGATNIDEFLAGLSHEEWAKVKERASAFSPVALNETQVSGAPSEAKPDSGGEKDKKIEDQAVTAKETIH